MGDMQEDDSHSALLHAFQFVLQVAFWIGSELWKTGEAHSIHIDACCLRGYEFFNQFLSY